MPQWHATLQLRNTAADTTRVRRRVTLPAGATRGDVIAQALTLPATVAEHGADAARVPLLLEDDERDGVWVEAGSRDGAAVDCADAARWDMRSEICEDNAVGCVAAHFGALLGPALPILTQLAVAGLPESQAR